MSVSTHSIYTDISLFNMTFYNMKQLLIFLAIIIMVPLLIYYTDVLDKEPPTEYTCSKIESILIGGWHPDVPQSVIQECKKYKLFQQPENRHATTT